AIVPVLLAPFISVDVNSESRRMKCDGVSLPSLPAFIIYVEDDRSARSSRGAIPALGYFGTTLSAPLARGMVADPVECPLWPARISLFSPGNSLISTRILSV